MLRSRTMAECADLRFSKASSRAQVRLLSAVQAAMQGRIATQLLPSAAKQRQWTEHGAGGNVAVCLRCLSSNWPDKQKRWECTTLAQRRAWPPE